MKPPITTATAMSTASNTRTIGQRFPGPTTNSATTHAKSAPRPTESIGLLSESESARMAHMIAEAAANIRTQRATPALGSSTQSFVESNSVRWVALQNSCEMPNAATPAPNGRIGFTLTNDRVHLQTSLLRSLCARAAKGDGRAHLRRRRRGHLPIRVRTESVVYRGECHAECDESRCLEDLSFRETGRSKGLDILTDCRARILYDRPSPNRKGLLPDRQSVVL